MSLNYYIYIKYDNYYSNVQIKDYSMTINIYDNIYDNIYENNMKTVSYFVKIKLLSKILKYEINCKIFTQVQHPFMLKSFKIFMYN